jgi:hypothetical protein
VKYGRAWRTKQRALKLICGYWAEAYERSPAMLHAMKVKNTRMHFEYVPKPDVMGLDGRQYFFRAFWIFRQCVEAFKHYYDVLSIDDTFLTGKYEGKMLTSMNINSQTVKNLSIY